MKTDGERNRNLTSACGSASHCRCTTSARARASDASDTEMLDRLQRQPQPRALEEPRGERVVALVALVAVGRRAPHRSETATSRPSRRRLVGPSAAASSWSYHGVNAGGSARSTRTRSSVDACSSAAGTSFTATRSRRAATRTSTRWSSSRRPTTRTCSACRRSRPGRSGSSRSGTSRRDRRSGRSRSRARVGRILTDVHHGLLRSAFAGQGNAIQLSSRLRVLAHWVADAEHPAVSRRPRRASSASERSSGSRGGRSGASSRRSASGPPTARATSSRTCTARATRPTSESRTPSCCAPPGSRRRTRDPRTSSFSPATSTCAAERQRTLRSAGRAGVGLLAARRRASITCSCVARRARRSGAGTMPGAPAATCCSQITPRSSSTST